MIDNRDGTFYTTEEYQELISRSTTDEIKKMEEQHMVEVKGSPEAVATLSAKLATSEAALRKLHADAFKKAYRKMR